MDDSDEDADPLVPLREALLAAEREFKALRESERWASLPDVQKDAQAGAVGLARRRLQLAERNRRPT